MAMTIQDGDPDISTDGDGLRSLHETCPNCGKALSTWLVNAALYEFVTCNCGGARSVAHFDLLERLTLGELRSYEQKGRLRADGAKARQAQFLQSVETELNRRQKVVGDALDASSDEGEQRRLQDEDRQIDKALARIGNAIAALGE